MAESDSLTSGIIRLTNSHFISLVIARHAFPWIGLLALAIILSVLASVFGEIRWLIVTLMITCLIAPMMMAFLYFNYGMREVTVINTLPHTLSFKDKGVVVTQYEDEEPYRSWLLPYSTLDRYYIGGKCIIVPLRDATRGFLWIPSYGFDKIQDFHRAVEIIAKHKSNSNIRNENP